MKQISDPLPKEFYRSQALCRAVTILDCFSFQNRELSLSEIVKRNSSCSFRKSASFHLAGFWSRTGLVVFMGIAAHRQLVYVEKMEGTGIIQLPAGIGWRIDLYFSLLVMMVLMAYLPESEGKQILREYPLRTYTPYSIDGPQVVAVGGSVLPIRRNRGEKESTGLWRRSKPRRTRSLVRSKATKALLPCVVSILYGWVRVSANLLTEIEPRGPVTGYTEMRTLLAEWLKQLKATVLQSTQPGIDSPSIT